MMKSTRLLEDYKALLASVPGAPERERVLSLLGEASVFIIEDSLTVAMSQTLNEASWTIEHNLDFLLLPDHVVWIEWNEGVRDHSDAPIRDGQHYPVKVGALLARHQEDPDTIVGSVAWRFADGKVDYAPAFISWNEEHLGALARDARHSYSKTPAHCWARMMSLIYTHVPDGFVGEMEALQDIKEDAGSVDDMLESARRESSAEAIFIFGLLMFMQSDRVEIEQLGSDTSISLKPPAKKSWLPKFQKPGFNRSVRKGNTHLKWKDVT